MTRVLKPHKRNALGFVSFWQCSPNPSEIYYQQVLTGVIDGITRSDYLLLLKNFQGILTNKIEGLKFFDENQLAGLVMMAPRAKKSDLNFLKRLDIPVVLLLYQPEGRGLSWVDLNNREGGRLAMEHLINLGHRRIAFIGGERELSTNARDRYEAYRLALKAAGIHEEPRWVKHGIFSLEFGRESAQELLSLPEGLRPTAVFCATDMIAIGAIQIAKEMALRVPEDFSVIGFDNYDQDKYNIPPLTTIRQPFYEMGRIAIEMLESIVQDPEQSPQQILIEPELIVRGSTNLPPSRSTPASPPTGTRF